jgi:CRISPR/Cas system CSM-associated protein Csm3 (group 7 of RAMP superfamily)
VSPGIKFKLEMVGDNLTDEEKGMLFTALDLISQGFGALGGNVSRGTGRIKIDITQIERLSPKDFFERYKKSGEEVAPDLITGDKLKEYIKEKKDAFFKKEWPEVKHV